MEPFSDFLKKRGHGGARAGAGRKSFRPSCEACGDRRAAVLAAAVRGARPLQFVMAATALGVPLDTIRSAMGLSQANFRELYIQPSQDPAD